MNGPGWPADVLAVLMLATAAYCAGRLVVARRWHRRAERDVDAAHVLTGVAMAGMLVPVLDPLAAPAWTAVFALTAASFAVRAALSLTGTGGGGGAVAVDSHRCPSGLRRHLPHLVLSGAMVYMYLALPAGWGTAGMSGMAGMSGPDDSAVGSARYPAVGLLLVLLLVGCAASVLGRALSPSAERAGGCAGSRSARGADGGLLAPRAADGCDIVMAVAMVYLLVLML